MTCVVTGMRLIAVEKAAESTDYMEDFADIYNGMTTAPCTGQHGALNIV